MKKKPAFQIDVFRIEQPLYMVGRAVRVTHGTPECFPAIDTLWREFEADDVTSAIPDKADPVIPFGICSDHIPHGGDIIEFTYMRAALVRERPADNQLPEGTICYAIPAGDFARIRVRAKNHDKAIGTAYIELDKWLQSSEWEGIGDGYEVYTSRVYNPETKLYGDKWPRRYEMEKWEHVRPRRKRV